MAQFWQQAVSCQRLLKLAHEAEMAINARTYRRARRALLDGSLGRLQAASTLAVDTLIAVARDGRRDGDRVRATVALLSQAGCASNAHPTGDSPESEPLPMGTADVVQTLTRRLGRIEQSELGAADKARLTATLSGVLLRAIGVDVIDKRLEALQTVLVGRRKRGAP
jgi:hypothetical protein